MGAQWGWPAANPEISHHLSQIVQECDGRSWRSLAH